ncbi:hypothetical protein FJZ28_02160 [Candidatus Peregrinibacteria bacterium]|nr:hypothetical protein [Candidatus Peregrinibacteria bacterium]
MNTERHEQSIIDEAGRYGPDEIDRMRLMGIRVERGLPEQVPQPDFEMLVASDRDQPWYSRTAENILRAIYTGNGEAVAQIRALIGKNDFDITHCPVRHLINTAAHKHFTEQQRAMVSAAIDRACSSNAKLDAIEATIVRGSPAE